MIKRKAKILNHLKYDMNKIFQSCMVIIFFFITFILIFFILFGILYME